MNMLRLIAIALPVMFLMACGGGGGGTATVTPTTPTNPNPPTGGVVNPLADLANFVPTTGSQTIQDIQAITGANGSNFILSHAYESGQLELAHMSNCASGVCVIVFNNPFAVSNFDTTSNNPNLAFFDSPLDNIISRITNSTDVGDINFARGSLTGRRGVGVGTNVEFQSFTGWLDGSIFGTTQLAFVETGQSSEQYRFISYAVGVPATSNPTTGTTTWEGAAVGSIKADRTFILGDAEITVDFTNSNVDLEFDNWRNLDNQELSSMQPITYNDLALSSGSFTGSGNEQVQGRFYGNSHEEVGGWFNTETLTGAFGGTRQ